MPSYTQEHHLSFTAKELFDLVADVENYPKFLPWCEASRILSRQKDKFTAELVISFNSLYEKYTSLVTLLPPTDNQSGEIKVKMVEGPFTHLVNNWKFVPNKNGGTNIEFFIDFQFKSKILNKLIGFMFEKAAKKMVEAFKNRAIEIYSK